MAVTNNNRFRLNSAFRITAQAYTKYPIGLGLLQTMNIAKHNFGINKYCCFILKTYGLHKC